MASLLKHIDLYGIHPDLFINKSEKYKSSQSKRKSTATII